MQPMMIYRDHFWGHKGGEGGYYDIAVPSLPPLPSHPISAIIADGAVPEVIQFVP